MVAKLSAANEDKACSDYYTKAGLSSSLGACIATAASRRRAHRDDVRRLDFFSEAEIDEAAMTAAENSLKAEGVTGVATTNGIDPIDELKTIDGVSSSALETFKTDAAAAASLAPTSPPPPPVSPPPPPPPSPPPKLVVDDDDAAHAPRDILGALLLACVTLLLY